MPVHIEETGAILGLMDQMIVPDFVVKGARLGHGRFPNAGFAGYLAVAAPVSNPNEVWLIPKFVIAGFIPATHGKLMLRARTFDGSPEHVRR
jgi:hypothetical protein